MRIDLVTRKPVHESAPLSAGYTAGGFGRREVEDA